MPLSEPTDRQPDPLVSVILTSHNYEKYVGEAIASVLGQTYPSIESIVVDDGSTDGSREVIEGKLKLARIDARAIYMERAGQAAAMNAGFALARGEVVTFLDSDDVWKPERVERMVAFMREFPGGGVYQHQLARGDGIKRNTLLSGDAFALWKGWSGGVFNVADDVGGALISPFAPTSGLAFRREVLERVFPVPVELTSCPDGFITRAACAWGPLYSLPAVLGEWRDHEANRGKTEEASFWRHWIPVVMPALNRYYRERGIDLKFVHDLGGASKRPACVMLGETSAADGPERDRDRRGAARRWGAGILRALAPGRVYQRLREFLLRRGCLK
jgi:glycosyltransferase involved in cell wall biosynthesis